MTLTILTTKWRVRILKSKYFIWLSQLNWRYWRVWSGGFPTPWNSTVVATVWVETAGFVYIAESTNITILGRNFIQESSYWTLLKPWNPGRLETGQKLCDQKDLVWNRKQKQSAKDRNQVVVSNIFYFHPYLGKIPILTTIFQRGWNHQLGNVMIPLDAWWFVSCGLRNPITFWEWW